ncbi:MAG: ATP-binding protein [Planctomycetota bacterium]
MGFINLAERTINAKLVYYGCGMGGKTTSLRVVHEIMCPRNEVDLVSINTEQDATLLFDFLPIDLGEVDGFKVMIQGFTVPGQPKYKRMRQYVLQGADAVVFVVDSERSRLEENLQSFESLCENLEANGLDPNEIPIVLQYNKRDLNDVLTEAELDSAFKFRDEITSFPSVATDGRGVFEAFVHSAGELVEAKVRLYGLGRGNVTSERVAEGARNKLWEIYDESGYNFGVRPDVDRVELTFEDGVQVDRKEIEDETALDAQFDTIAETVSREANETPDSSESGEGLFPLDLLEGGLEALDDPASTEPAERAAPQSLVEERGPDPIDDEEPHEELLGATIATNLALAERHGELERRCSMLERRNQELVELAQNALHDLRRPLTAMRLILGSMQGGVTGELGERSMEALSHALQAVDQMERLSNDLVDSTRLDFNGVDFEFEDVDLDELLQEVVRDCATGLESVNADVQVADLGHVKGNRWALQRALSNLVANAVQYAHPDRDLVLSITSRRGPERTVLEIGDNGVGIPPADRDRLFRRFERGSNTQGISGSGLGLHIVREAILGHGGAVWLESKLDVGTTFSIGLPHEPVQPEHDIVAGVSERPSTSTSDF